MRVAIYWAPELDDPLHAAGSAWLGRDAETAARVPQPAIPGLAEITADPRGYGLHATLKPPFRLATRYQDFIADAARWATGLAPFALPPLSVQDLKGFLALRETAPCPPLHALADSAVSALDHHRAPPTEEELARRRKAKLSPVHEALLERWGYPYVMEEWQFHITLTHRLLPEEAARIRPLAEAHFAGLVEQPRVVGTVCVFTQAAPGQPFLIAERLSLSAPAA
jgi:putative phosphonate metabolism protein